MSDLSLLVPGIECRHRLPDYLPLGMLLGVSHQQLLPQDVISGNKPIQQEEPGHLQVIQLVYKKI